MFDQLEYNVEEFFAYLQTSALTGIQPGDNRTWEAGREWSLRTAAEWAGLEPGPAADASRIETK